MSAIRSLAILLGSAGAILLLWFLVQEDELGAGGGGVGSLGAAETSSASVPRGRPLSHAEIERFALPEGQDYSKPAESASAAGDEVRPAEDFVRSKALQLVGRVHGLPIPIADRSFVSEEIQPIVLAWLADPSRKEEDLRVLRQLWQSQKDPAVRWALSWLLQRAQHPLAVEPLAELAETYPTRAIAALSSNGGDSSRDALIALAPDLANPLDLGAATAAIARLGGEPALDYLKDLAQRSSAPGNARIAAVEGLGNLADWPTAGDLAWDLMTGPARPVPSRELGELALDHPEGDLRSPAMLAALRLASSRKALLLIERVDRSADPALVAMLDRSLHNYQGPSIANAVFDRIERRSRVAVGEANYLARIASTQDLPQLRRALARATEPRAQAILRTKIEQLGG